MMKNSLKYLLGLWVVLLLVAGVLLYNAYSKLRPEIFIALLTEQVQKNYPGTRLEVGKVDYRLSVDFNMGLNNVLLKRDGKVIGSLQEIELRIPWWLLLFHKGNAQINLTGLSIYVDDDNVPEFIEAKKSPSSPLRISLSVPDYLARAQFTLRAKDVKVMDMATSRRYFTLNKLLVREFQFGKNSAFELNLPIIITHHGLSYKTELWLFGDLTPEKTEWDLKFRGEFRTSEAGEKFHMDDLIIDGKAKFKPHEIDVSSSLTFFVEKEEMGRGTFKAGEREFSVDLKLTKFPMNFLGLFEEEIKNPYLPQLSEKASGSVHIRKHYKNEAVKLSGDLNFPGVFRVGSATESEVTGKWRLSFDDVRWETSFISPKGEVSFFRRSVVDFKEGKIAQYVEELGFTELDFSQVVQAVMPLDKVLSADATAYSSTSVSFKRCFIGDKVIEGNFRYGISPDQRFYVADLREDKSVFKINFNQGLTQRKLDVELLNFNWMPQYTFLIPYFEAHAGTLDGRLEGRWSGEWVTGQWLSRLKAQGLQSVKGEWVNFIDGFWKTFSLEAAPVPGQNWNLSLRNGQMTVDSLLLEGVDPAKMNGEVDTSFKKKSFLTLSYPKNKKWRPVKKEILEAFWEKEP